LRGRRLEEWEKFSTVKKRGEWAELQFMAAAAQRRFMVCKPYGDSGAYDVGVDHGLNYIRVQVKSSTSQRGRGYWCDFTRFEHYNDYTLEEVDLFAAYVIPENVWYLIPAAQLVRDRKRGAMLCPVVQPVKKNTFRYEGYKDAWWLLTKSRRGLGMCGRGRM
jgi:hypothetical protein